MIFELSGWDIEPCDANAGIETLEKRIFQLLFSGQSRQPPLHLPHLVDVERDHGHPITHFSWHFFLLISVRQRTDKEAVAAGLFAVLGRKRGTVSGQVREEPDQLSWLWAFQPFTPALLPFFLLCLSGNNKQGVCRLTRVSMTRLTSSEPSTHPQLMELVDGSRQTNFSL